MSLFLNLVISVSKQRSDNSDYSPQTDPNQFKPVGMIDFKKTDVTLTFVGHSHAAKISNAQSFLIFWIQSEFFFC